MELFAQRVLVVGCVHSDTGWLVNTVLPAARDLSCEAVLVAGDFGYWGSSPKLVQKAGASLKRFGVATWFIDGNHEDHPRLRKTIAALGDGSKITNITGSLYHIGRGGVVTVGGLKVVGMGGAASIDKGYRSQGVDWFEEELIDDHDVNEAIAAGRGDVLVSHDAPSGWEIPGIAPRETLDEKWLQELPDCEAHQRILRVVYESVVPKILIHSHYHSGYEIISEEAWGDVRVVGLDQDHTTKWGRVLYEKNGEPALSDWVTR